MAKYNKTITGKIIKLIESGVPNKYSAQASGVSEKTFYEWIKIKGEFGELIKKAESKRVENLIKDIATAKSKDGEPIWTARAWLLERLDRGTFHLPSVTEEEMRMRMDEIEIRIDKLLDKKQI